MTAKNAIIEFLSFIFFLGLLVLAYFFFIVGDRVEDLGEILLTFIPLAMLIAIYLIVFNFRRKEIEKRREENDDELILYLELKDKLIADVLPFLLSMAIIVFAWFSPSKIDKFDIMVSLLVFFVFMTWNSYIFKKE